MDNQVVYFVAYNDEEFGTFEYGIYSNIEEANKGFELAKLNIKEFENPRYKYEWVEQDLDDYEEKHGYCSMLYLYSNELNKTNTYKLGEDKYPEGLFENKHIKVIKFDMLMREYIH